MSIDERPSHLGLRHLALNAVALDEMRRFYVELLGFAVEWQPDADNVYLTSGTDNLALHRVSAREAGGALDHLGLLVKSPDEVDRWAAFLSSRGIAIDAQPRTHRDGARSCYVRDPDGNRIQIIFHAPISSVRRSAF